MINKLLLYLMYGFIAGFSEFTPVSASAHQSLFSIFFRFESTWPMLRFFVHVGSLAGLGLLYWQRLSHIYNEVRLASLPPRQRKKLPDKDAVLDWQLSLMTVVPTLIASICSAFLFQRSINLLWLTLLLIGGAILIYLPDYVPGGDRKANSMSPLEGILLGVCAGCSIIPGVSSVGLMLAVGLLLKCDRGYLLNLIFLISGIMLAERILIDFISIFATGFYGFSIFRLIGCVIAAAASFGGSIGAILMMRFLSVKTGFSGFAFYGWGLGLFSYVLYLMV